MSNPSLPHTIIFISVTTVNLFLEMKQVTKKHISLKKQPAISSNLKKIYRIDLTPNPYPKKMVIIISAFNAKRNPLKI
jgi:hypothetical protein